MYQESIDLLSEQQSYKPNTLNFNNEYISLIEKIVTLTKANKRDKSLELVSLAMANELPNYCSSYYLELAFLIKKAELKISTLSLIFEKLADEEKVIVREEIKKAFKTIRSPKSQWKILFHIRHTKDKELLLFCQPLIEKLSLLNEPYLFEKYLLLQDLSNYLDDEIEIKRLQKQALVEATRFGDARDYWALSKLFDEPLLAEVKQEAISYAIENWPKLALQTSLSSRVYVSRILKHFPSDIAQTIREELYLEIKKLSSSKNKTEIVELLVDLAFYSSGSSSSEQLRFWKEVIWIIALMEDGDTIEEGALYRMVFSCPNELALEISQVLLNKFNPCSNPRLLVILLTRLLSKIEIEEKRMELADKVLSLATKEKERLGLDRVLSHFLMLVEYIGPKLQKHFAAFVFYILLGNVGEEKQAEGFAYVAKYLDKEDKGLLLSTIDKMESNNRVTALASVLRAFEGQKFLSLATRLLDDLKATSLDKQINNLTMSLILSIGKQLTKQDFFAKKSPQ
jgi:hypothetical protein